MFWLWHDRLRDMALQAVVLATVLLALERVAQVVVDPSYPRPLVWTAIGSFVGAGNALAWRYGKGASRD